MARPAKPPVSDHVPEQGLDNLPTTLPPTPQTPPAEVTSPTLPDATGRARGTFPIWFIIVEAGRATTCCCCCRVRWAQIPRPMARFRCAVDGW